MNNIDKFNDVRAIALLKDGKSAGRIIGHWSKNRNGSVCTVLVELFDHNGKYASGWGKAGGYGYDKFSAAISSALIHAGLNVEDYDTLSNATFANNDKEREIQKKARRAIKKSGKIGVYSGAGNERKAFENAGYEWLEIV